jgi:perosamine synthetase
MHDKLAIFGGSKINKSKTPKYNTIGKNEIRSVNQILKSGELSGFAAAPNQSFYGGVWVRKLEKEFCKKYNSKYAVAVNSATSALYCMLMASGIGPGDEVITSPYTMHATASSILQCGAVPIFSDIEDKTYGLDPDKVSKLINRNTKGILAVNIFGHVALLEELRLIAKKNKIWLMEDNSQSPSALDEKGRYAGTVGIASAFSFNRHKTMQSGEGGVILTSDKKIYYKSCLVRNHGESVVEPWGIKDITNTIGQNLRITEIHAAIAFHQFKKLKNLNSARIKLANRISKGLKDIDGISAPIVRKKCKHVYYFYVMQYDEKKIGIKRDDFVKAINAEGYYLRSGYLKPLHLEPIFKKKICFGSKGYPFILNSRNKKIIYKEGLCKVAENLNSKKVILTNIIYPPFTIKDMDKFILAIKKVIKNKKYFN